MRQAWGRLQEAARGSAKQKTPSPGGPAGMAGFPRCGLSQPFQAQFQGQASLCVTAGEQLCCPVGC